MSELGRPQKPIDWKIVDGLVGIQCTKREICEVLGISEDTLSRRCQGEHGVTFAVYFAQKGASGRRSLRAKQYEIAMSGNVTMLIWLGKQYLNQTDKVESSGPDGGPQVIITMPSNGRDQSAQEVKRDQDAQEVKLDEPNNRD